MTNYVEDSFFSLPAQSGYPYQLSSCSSLDVTTLGSGVSVDIQVTSVGAAAAVSITKMGDGGHASEGENYLTDFYNRIWVIPSVLVAQNPQVGYPIDFAVWNSFLSPATNLVETITSSGAGALDLSLSFSVLSSFAALEYRVATITINYLDPSPIDTVWQFGFQHGSAPFEFIATLASLISDLPDVPVTETWEFLTDVQVAYDGSEQRISLLRAPRRSMSFDLPIQLTSEWQAQWNNFFSEAKSPFVFPMFQYATAITVFSAAGSTRIYFDPSATDMRQGEDIYLFGPGIAQLASIATLESDGAILSFPTQQDIGPQGNTPGCAILACPVLSAYVANKTKLTMDAVTGKLPINAKSTTLRASVLRPGSSVSLTMHGGFPVLDKRPLNSSPTTTEFDYGGEMFDYGTGQISVYTSWLRNKLIMTRAYKINRVTAPAEMDWWRTFLNYCNGQQQVFWTPTWRPDLTLATPLVNASAVVIVSGPLYSRNFYSSGTGFQAICVETSAGVMITQVESIGSDGFGNDVLNISPPMPSGALWQRVSNISVVVKSRLGSDKITFSHGVLSSTIDITLMSAES